MTKVTKPTPEHLDKVRNSLTLACKWLTDVAQVKNDSDLDPDCTKLMHTTFVGAMRGEYRAATRKWGFFCPVWHTGQAVKALVNATPHVGDHLLEAAHAGADFILGNQITDGPDAGLITAYEDEPDKVNSSAIIESLDGLFALSAKTGESRYADAAIAALQWLRDNSFMHDEGLFRDEYEPKKRQWSESPYGTIGRPLLDDAAFVKGYQLTGDKSLLDVAVRTAERLLADENPAGNWVGYAPCIKETGSIHPRHAYWWGLPMLTIHEVTGDDRYLECFKRSVQWYQKALRRDGTFLRGTFTDFSTNGLSHAMSGSAGAVICFQAYHHKTGDDAILADIERGMNGCLNMQFTHAKDPNLQGAILEKIIAHGGSDDSPYHLRDLSSIFYAQAASAYLNDNA